MIAHENKNFFYCYNPKLRRFIHENGIKWIDKGINKNSGYMRWIFERSEELDRLIIRYKNEH